MKKRILSVALMLCLMISLVNSIPASAAKKVTVNNLLSGALISKKNKSDGSIKCSAKFQIGMNVSGIKAVMDGTIESSIAKNKNIYESMTLTTSLLGETETHTQQQYVSGTDCYTTDMDGNWVLTKIDNTSVTPSVTTATFVDKDNLGLYKNFKLKKGKNTYTVSGTLKGSDLYTLGMNFSEISPSSVEFADDSVQCKLKYTFNKKTKVLKSLDVEITGLNTNGVEIDTYIITVKVLKTKNVKVSVPSKVKNSAI